MIKKQSFESSRTTLNSPLCTLETTQSYAPPLLALPLSHPDTLHPHSPPQKSTHHHPPASERLFEGVSKNIFELCLNDKDFQIDCTYPGSVEEELQRIYRISGVGENIYHSLKLVIVSKMAARHPSLEPLLVKAMDEYSQVMFKQIDETWSGQSSRS